MTPSGQSPQQILIIKLGALGDMVQALGPMAAIRHHHPEANIVALTTQPYEELLRASGYVDDIWLNTKPRKLQIGSWLDLRTQLRSAGFQRVYDLQTSDRSGFYYRLFWPGPYPEWSGIAQGCSHPHANPGRDHMHTVDRQAEQLSFAGIDHVPPADLSWIDSDTHRLVPEESIFLMVPGGAPHRPAKRWPAERYAALARDLANSGVTPVLLGATSEKDLLSSIAGDCSAARNLCGETTLFDLAALARRALGAVGNDTGPMHLLAAAGCPCTVLFSADSSPDLCVPRGRAVNFLQRSELQDLSLTEVLTALQAIAAGLPSLSPAGAA